MFHSPGFSGGGAMAQYWWVHNRHCTPCHVDDNSNFKGG